MAVPNDGSYRSLSGEYSVLNGEIVRQVYGEFGPQMESAGPATPENLSRYGFVTPSGGGLNVPSPATWKNLPANTWISAGDLQTSPYAGYTEAQIANAPFVQAEALRATGYTGELYTPEGGLSPAAQAAFNNLKAQGYDVAIKAPTAFSNLKSYGLRDPSGNVTPIFDYEGVDTTIGGVIKQTAPVWLGALGGYLANSTGLFGGTSLGGATTAADLAGGSADLIPGVMGGGQFDAAGSVPENLLASSLGGGVTETLNTLPYTTGATTYPVGQIAGTTPGGMTSAELAALQAPGIAEGMAPGVLAPATAAELAGLSAIAAAPAAAAVPAATAAAPVEPFVEPYMTAPSAATAAAPAPNFLAGMSDVAAIEGPGVAGTGILTAGTNIPSAVIGAAAGGSLLDNAVKFITSPAGSALVNAGANIVGGITSASAAKEAAQTQAAAADRATELQREMYNKFLEMNKPYYEAGVNALGKITRGEVQTEPGYGFRLGEGMKALERLQASRGSLLSGGAIRGGQRYAQDLASQEYGNAYNRLANLAGIGQTATSQAGAAGQNLASAVGGYGLQGANALAAGRVGRTSSYTNALMGVGQALAGYGAQQQQNEYMNRLLDLYGQRIGG